jgi:6-phosphogluconolactonase (cycloisomerase 2 family)
MDYYQLVELFTPSWTSYDLFKMLGNKLSVAIVSLVLGSPATADILYATSYNDHSLNILSLQNGSLSVVAKSYDCGSEPTWMTLDIARSNLYCLNEGWGGNASITSYKKSANGSLTALDLLPVTKSPVAATLFGPNNNDLAVAF